MTVPPMSWCVFEVFSAVAVLLGVFLSYGSYQHDGTWNLMRNSATLVDVRVPAADPTHFRLRQLFPVKNSKPQWSPPVLFVPGHMGKYTQVINIASYVSEARPVAFYSVDFHASASALHASIVLQQASFVSAAVERISELYEDAGVHAVAVTLISHSMGATVAQEAVRLLASRRSHAQVKAMIVLCGPLFGHPLLFEPRTAMLLANSRRAYWETQIWTSAISAGETDALVPNEVAVWPNSTGIRGVSIVAPAMRDVHASFSHVNIVFSRHALHAVANLVDKVVDERLDEVDLTSTFTGLFSRSLSSGIGAQPTSHVEWLLLTSSVTGAASFQAFSFSDLAGAPQTREPLSPVPPIAWSSFKSGLTHIIPFANAEVFSLLLFEEPRSIMRAPERSSRGEDFDAHDRVNCSRVAKVQTALFGERDSLTEWRQVSAMTLQYPSKACLFHVAVPPIAANQIAVVSVQRGKVRKGSPAIVGWAQLHDEPLNFEVPDVGVLSWAAMVFGPRTAHLPAGRAVISRLSAPVGALAPCLPLDFVMDAGDGSALPWGPQALLLAADSGGVVSVAAARSEQKPPSLGWAAESDPGIFTPRFSAIQRFGEPVIFVVGDPTRELSVQIRANVWAALSRVFRTYLGHIMACWLGAAVTISNQDTTIAFWMVASCLVLLVWPESPRTGDGYVPGTPPWWVLIFVHFLGVGIASAVQTLTRSLAWVSLAVPTRCRCPFALDMVLLVLGACLHPGACLVFILLRAIKLHGMLRSDLKSAQGDPGQCSGRILYIAEFERWVSGFVSLLIPFVLCYTPSLILTVWVILGQHCEASAPQFQEQLSQDLVWSRHALSPWVDSLFLEHRAELRDLIAVPALGLLLPGFTLVFQSASYRHVVAGSTPRFLYVARYVLIAMSVVLVRAAGQHSSNTWFACQPLFLVHLIAMVAGGPSQQLKVE